MMVVHCILMYQVILSEQSLKEILSQLQRRFKPLSEEAGTRAEEQKRIDASKEKEKGNLKGYECG